MSSCLPLLVMHDCRSTPWHLTGGLPSRKRWRTATRHWWRCCYPMAPSSIRWALPLSSRAASLSLSLSLSSLSLLALLLQHALSLLALLQHARTLFALSVRSAAAAALTLSARSAAARTHSLCSLCSLCCCSTHSLCSLCCCTHSLPAPAVAAPSARSAALSLSLSLSSLSVLRAKHDTDAFRAASSAPTMRLAADHFGIGTWR